MAIKITKGDVLESKIDGLKVIVHCCNDISSFGSGVAGNISRKWPRVREEYLCWKTEPDNPPFVLGQIQLVKAEKDTFVCNLIGQRDIGGFTIGKKFIPAVRYEAIEEGFWRLLDRVDTYSGPENISIHAPLLGCGLAGGCLEQIYSIASRVFDESTVDFTFYAFSDEDWVKLQEVKELFDIREAQEILVCESLLGADEEDIKEYQNHIDYIESGRTDRT